MAYIQPKKISKKLSNQGLSVHETKGSFGSMVWSMEFDKDGNLWFTDQVNNAIWKYFINERKFEMYRVPTIGSYPQGLLYANAELDID